jgi:hypothetical protein
MCQSLIDEHKTNVLCPDQTEGALNVKYYHSQ